MGCQCRKLLYAWKMNNNTPPKDTKHARDVCTLGLMAVFSIFVQPSSVILNQTLHMLLWLIWFSEWFWRAQTKCLLGKGSEVPFLSHSSWMHRLPNTDVGCTTSWTSGCYLPNTCQKKAQTIQSSCNTLGLSLCHIWRARCCRHLPICQSSTLCYHSITHWHF